MRDYTGLTDEELYQRLDDVAFEAEALRREVIRRGRAKAEKRLQEGGGNGYYGPYGYGSQDR